jgi:hypothetical protein
MYITWYYWLFILTIIAEELDLLLTKAKIKPPYILVGV